MLGKIWQWKRDECGHLLSWLIGPPGRDVILKRKKESFEKIEKNVIHGLYQDY